MMAIREQWKADSNNAVNPCKNICTSAVTDAFGVTDRVRYLHTVSDVVRAVRTRYTVRSRKSAVRGNTVGAIRPQLAGVTAKVRGRVIGYILRVPGHVLVLDPTGKTVVDTAPRKRDRREVCKLYVVYREGRF